MVTLCADHCDSCFIAGETEVCNQCDVTDQGHTASTWLQPGHRAPKHTFQERVASATLDDNYKHTMYLLRSQLCSLLVYIYYYLFSSLILVTSLWGGAVYHPPFIGEETEAEKGRTAY